MIKRRAKRRGGTLSVSIIVIAFLVVMVVQVVQLKQKESTYTCLLYTSSMREKASARHREQALQEVLALRFFLDLRTWSLNPVSYTHLDVYKRQELIYENGSLFVTIFENNIVDVAQKPGIESVAIEEGFIP